MEKKVVIIGAGIAGLSAGCYARMNGYDVEIHEAHNLPGGLCTTWTRHGYTIDGCIHWLTGSSPGGILYRIYEELGAVQGRQMFDHDVFASIRGVDGRTLHLYTNVDHLEAHMKQLSPQDEAEVDKLCGMIRRLAHFPMPLDQAPELMGRVGGLRMVARMLPYMRDLMALGDLTLAQLGARFADPLLRSGIANTLFDQSVPANALVMTLAPMSIRAAGFPLGGSLEFARALERRLLDLGGRIVYRSRVEQVTEHAGHATGVRLASGEEVRADYVIAACDLRTALFSLLDGSRVDPLHQELLDHGRVYPSAVLVTFGVDMDMSDDISCFGTLYELEQPIEIGGRRLPYLGIKNFCYDPSLAPPNKSVVQLYLAGDWAYWERLRGDREAYDAAKAQVLDICCDQVERRHPGFAARIEMTDVATPYTFERYTGNWHGTFMTWILSGDFQRKHPYIPKTVPGLSGFYTASMWTNPPGGIPGAASAGRMIAQILCHEDRQPFITTTP